jgi:hypothetical protein
MNSGGMIADQTNQQDLNPKPKAQAFRGAGPAGGMMHRGCRRCAMWIKVDAPPFVCGLLCSEIHEPFARLFTFSTRSAIRSLSALKTLPPA